ncbi:tyrosine-type recombinase/integrase [Alkaliphilus metalliredigens]|nr:site-specific integrase [Alkaliphilus metalliredigens]
MNKLEEQETGQLYAKSINYNEIIIGNSRFCDDIWDLTPLMESTNIHPCRKKIKFLNIESEDMKFTAKQYTYYKLGQISPRTVLEKIRTCLSTFIKFAKLKKFNSFAQVDKVVFYEYVDWLQNSYRIQTGKNNGMQLSRSTGYKKSQCIEEIIKVGQIKGWNVCHFNFTQMNSWEQWKPDEGKRDRKYKPIPENVFNRILDCAINKEKNIITKAAIIIQSQTGLRISEVLSIKENCIQSTDNNSYYLEVQISKTVKGEPENHKVFVNELVVNAVRELEESTKELRRNSGLRELFIFKRYGIVVVNPEKFTNDHLSRFIKRWNIIDDEGKLYGLRSHQFRATLVRELIKKQIPLAYIMKHFNHVSIEMTAHYLTLSQKEIKEMYADMILRPQSKLGGIKANELKTSLQKEFKGKTVKEVNEIIEKLSNSMNFNPLPTGVCLYDFRRGNCTDGDGCFIYNCPNYITEVRFYPVLKMELELIEKEMDKLKSLGRERDWQRVYIKWECLKPLVDELEEQYHERK